ncbi:Importin subunit alpha-1 [Desmophyllum pertusum]|uniref:Importin subunit alpha n=1 Tax=Desmophyllum pertusum TaxID=174260 RepID=A0A9X0CZR0_9CNID|nr:Importin subunit alpha-1 [Desmophyllum pertusum]
MSENRIQNFKNRGKDSNALRRMRNDVTIQLRKTNRENQVLKRRNITEDEPVSPLQERNSQQQTVTQLPLATIEEYLKSNDDKVIFEAVQISRKMLSKQRNPPIKDFIASGLVSMFVAILERFDNASLQFEAAWVLTNIASGSSDETKVVVEAGAVPRFVKLLTSPQPQVCEQAVWALGNIAGDGPNLRNFVLAHGALGPLLGLIQLDINIQFLRNITWTLSNLCRNKNPPPETAAVEQILPALAHLIKCTDKEVLSDTCWGLSYLTDGTNDRIQLVIDSGILLSLIPLLGHPEVNVVTPSLRAVGNIVTGSDDQTQLVIQHNALFYFKNLLTHSKASIVKEATWAISNITAGPKEQIQSVINAGLVPLIIDVLKGNNSARDFKSQKEAVWAITNFTSASTTEQIDFLVQKGVIEPMCHLLEVKDTKIILVLLDGFKNILTAASNTDTVMEVVCNEMHENEGVQRIESLQTHQNFEVYKAALALIDKFFSEESAEETEEMAPEATSKGFTFGTPQSLPVGGFQF